MYKFKLAIVILSWNGHHDTIECIDSIYENEYKNIGCYKSKSQECVDFVYENKNKSYKIFLLDNGSNHESVEKIEKWIFEKKLNCLSIDDYAFDEMSKFDDNELIFIKNNENLGFAKGNNYIIKKVKNLCEYILLLNNDVTIETNAISNMIRYIDENKNVGLLSCDIRYYDNKNKLWNAGGKFTWYGDRKYYSQNKIEDYIKKSIEAIKTPFITGCAMLIRTNIIHKYGMFTEKFFFGEEDFNYCRMLEKYNVEIRTLLTSKIYHKVSSSIKQIDDKNHFYSNYILHFTNRIIDQKSFYRYFYWLIWRSIYLFALMVKMSLKTKNIHKSIESIKKIKNYTLNYDEVDYTLFKEIKLNN